MRDHELQITFFLPSFLLYFDTVKRLTGRNRQTWFILEMAVKTEAGVLLKCKLTRQVQKR